MQLSIVGRKPEYAWSERNTMTNHLLLVLERLGLPVVPRQHRHAAALQEARRRQVRARGGVGGGGAPKLQRDASGSVDEWSGDGRTEREGKVSGRRWGGLRVWGR